MFAYCGNNPVNMVDAGGESPTAVVVGGLGLLKAIGGLLVTASKAFVGLFVTVVAVDEIASSGVISRPSVKTNEKTKEETREQEKEKVFPFPQRNDGTTYYHVTTLESAKKIMKSGCLIGSKWEGGHVYAWKTKPSKKAIKISGAHMGVTISFKTNASFVPDAGISSVSALMYGPVVSFAPGPIYVWDVMIVG